MPTTLRNSLFKPNIFRVILFDWLLPYVAVANLGVGYLGLTPNSDRRRPAKVLARDNLILKITCSHLNRLVKIWKLHPHWVVEVCCIPRRRSLMVG